MITQGENRVLKMIAVGSDGDNMPPCGRCSDFINQIHDENLSTEVIVDNGVSVTLKDPLPHDWRK